MSAARWEKGSRRKKGERSGHNGTLFAILAGVGVVVLMVALSRLPPSPWKPLDSLVLDGRIIPQLPPAATPEGDMAAAGDAVKRVELYLDTSQPMGGYLGEAERGALFRTFFKHAQVKLIEAYGGRHRLTWSAIDSRVVALQQEPRFAAESQFRGITSNLNLAVDEAKAALFSGAVSASVLVTDLVPTRQIDGAIALAETLQPFFDRREVRSGAVDLGLFAVKLPYRGVSTSLDTRCRVPQTPSLGCWLSEDEGRWQPLAEVVERPLYLIVLGRSQLQGEQAPAESAVQQIGLGLAELAEGMALEFRWELLTAAYRQMDAELSCSTDGEGENQTALWSDEARHYRCQQEASVNLTCTIDVEGTAETRALLPSMKVRAVQASWPEPWLRTRIGGPMGERSFSLIVDCEALRKEEPPSPALSVGVSLAFANESGWGAWSTTSDSSRESLGRTLWLEELVDSIRLKGFEFQSMEPILRERED